MTASRIWIGVALVYMIFFYWYTSQGGPLTPEEIEHYYGILEERGGDPERLAVWRTFMETDTGDDFAMLNAIEFREKPLPAEGAAPGETSQEVMMRYVEPFMAKALMSAAHPVLIGTATAPAMDIWGIEGASQWSQGGVVRYRSRRDLMEQAIYAAGSDIHRFKVAAMEKTVAYPLDPWFQLGDPRLVLALVLTILGLALHLRAARAATRT